ncbi:MAG: hypothetical protein KDD51_08620 [Bdellovibrionales bacterium]|nr:hypothetical protein [Bdellovibrionales bacterium]
MKTCLALVLVVCGTLSHASPARLRLTVPAREVQVSFDVPVVAIQPVYLANFGVEWGFDLLRATQVAEIEVHKPAGIIEKLSFHQVFTADRLLGVSSSRTPAQKAAREAWGVPIRNALTFPGDMNELKGAKEYGAVEVHNQTKVVVESVQQKVDLFKKRLAAAQDKSSLIVLSLPLGSDEVIVEYPASETKANEP